MKAVWKLALRTPNIISLANGDPHNSLYPISQIDFKVPAVNTENPCSEWKSGDGPTQTFTSYKDKDCALSLQVALQYGAGAGLLDVRKTLSGFNEMLHGCTSATHDVTLSLGNADALTKCFRLLGDPGDSFLVEEFSFPGMTNAPLAHGIKWVPVMMDEDGILPTSLESILEAWDTDTRGKRPHVLYTIPSGQNPTGGTLTLERRREIYKIACRWNLIILEDDPYYFLQYDRKPVSPPDIESEGYGKTFAKTLIPSFLSMDKDGRVIRIDSFSKIIVPGMRLGWIASNPFFAEKLESLTDSSTQHPHGFGQAFVAEMLGPKGWGPDGFMRWVGSLCDEYQRKRDFFLKIFLREVGDNGFATVGTPTAGMFVWIKVHLERHPRYAEEGPTSSNVEELMDELFNKLFDGGVLLMPAKTFACPSDNRDSTRNKLNHFRATFAGVDGTIENALVIFGKVLREFFGEHAAS
ncbi:PLP-dependent transferase [Rickenella mellea]|uniref:PLP-dependent transferase n=1 Tax=Rickenella mellea TaxID=50990 RepID=A0A4Y7QCB7_9AGAM|nr:PLP-dependent transferase [Rickenella mellea]